MLESFSEFKFFHSFRLPISEISDVRFLMDSLDEFVEGEYVDDAKLIDISLTGLSFSSKEKVSVGTVVNFSLHFKKVNLDLSGKVVRSFTGDMKEETLVYGVELDEEPKIKRFLELYIYSLNHENIRDSFIDLALTENYATSYEGFEMFSLLLSLFKDMVKFGTKEEFVKTMLEEVIRILNARRGTVFLINPETNELEANVAIGMEKDSLHFDYRLGVAGSVFTSGLPLNINTQSECSRFFNKFDKQTGFETRSIICHPIFNREDKVIGVIEILNKRNEELFTIDDEKAMRIISLVFSCIYYNYNPITEGSQIRRFSTPFNREYALVGKSDVANYLRESIVKLKDLEIPVLITGGPGSGKRLLAKVIHYEGNRGLNPFHIINCSGRNEEHLKVELFGDDEHQCCFEVAQRGTIVLNQIHFLPFEMQEKLVKMINAGGLPGSNMTIDARIICTSSKDIKKMAHDGEFNQELFEYLSQANIMIKSLRSRIEDMEDLVYYLLKTECTRQGMHSKELSPSIMDKFSDYDWPGNIQELRTVISQAVLYNSKNHIISDCSSFFTGKAHPFSSMFEGIPHVLNSKISLKDRMLLIERQIIMAEIKNNNGNKSKTAKEMGISREALRKKLIQSENVQNLLNDKTPEDNKSNVTSLDDMRKKKEKEDLKKAA